MDVEKYLRSIRFDFLLGRRPQNFQEVYFRCLAQFNFLDLGRRDFVSLCGTHCVITPFNDEEKAKKTNQNPFHFLIPSLMIS
jgi:hypothetical protein